MALYFVCINAIRHVPEQYNDCRGRRPNGANRSGRPQRPSDGKNTRPPWLILAPTPPQTKACYRTTIRINNRTHRRYELTEISQAIMHLNI